MIQRYQDAGIFKSETQTCPLCTMVIYICTTPNIYNFRKAMQLQNQAHFHVDYTSKIVQLCNNAFIITL